MISNAFRYNSGIVRFSGTPFFTGDGTTTSAQLIDRHGNPISSSKLEKVSSMHRTDWQGRQLLYPTARTNLCLQSDNPSAAPWAFYNVSGSANVVGNTITFGASSIDRIICGKTAVSATTYTASVTLSGSGSIRLFIVDGAGSTGAPLNIALTSTPTRYVYSRLLLNAGSLGSFGIYNGSAGAAGVSFTLHYAQFEVGAVSTSYISTTTSAVTVTDYTLSGSTVNFGETPSDGAILDWDGVSKR